MPTEYTEIDKTMWAESSLNRVTSYLTTNAMIHVSLCGLFATTVSVLVALAEQPGNEARSPIYQFVIPLFSVVILTVSLNVSSWISKQLTYLEWFSRGDSSFARFLIYEEFSQFITSHWEAKNKRQRISVLIAKTFSFYVTIPIRLNDIYCYYFLLYTATPIVGLAVIGGCDALWPEIPLLAALQVLLIGIGLKGYLVLQIVKDDLHASLVSGHLDLASRKS